MARSAVTQSRLRKIGAEIGIDGIEEIQANIARTLTRASGEQFKKEVCMPAAMIIVRSARERAPVRTGALRSAIFAALGDRKKPNVIVGVNYKRAPHAHLVEYGFSGAQGHPYMRPAITANRSAVAASLAKDMRKLIGAPFTGPAAHFSIGGEFL